ncbi:MAG: hypothetical protein AAF685_08850 [Cyanobacteria bacterium P01_C01_bin.89]
MHQLAELHAVVKVPRHRQRLVYPWNIQEIKSFSLIRLWKETSSIEIGSVFLELAEYNRVSINSDAQDVISLILRLSRAAFPGGIHAISQKEGKRKPKTIYPMCCCDLENWHDWIDFLKTGNSPWMGHSPDPGVERTGDIVRIYSDMKSKKKTSKKYFYIESSYSYFKQQVKQVERDLNEFLLCIEAWVDDLGVEEGEELKLKFSEWFHISPPIFKNQNQRKR